MSYHEIWLEVRKYYFLSYAVYYSLFLVATYFLHIRNEGRFFLQESSLFDFTLSMDNVYFINNNYMWEHQYVFLPCYVMVLKAVRWLASIFVADETLQKKTFLLLGLILNAVFVAIASINLYKLTQIITKRKSVAKVACIIFYFSLGGASLRMLYSEAFFCLLVFWAVRLAYQKIPEWEPVIDSPLKFLRINALSLFLFWTASTVRSTLILLSPVFGIPILQTLYSEFRGDRRITRMIGIAITGAMTLMIFGGFIFIWNLFGYYQFCTIDTPSWFCKDTPFNMYGAVQQRHWKVTFYFSWLIKTALEWGFTIFDLGIHLLFCPYHLITAFSFKRQYPYQKSLGILVSYAIFLFVTFSWGYWASLNRFLTTHPLFTINNALFLMSDTTEWPLLKSVFKDKKATKRFKQLLVSATFIRHVIESTFRIGSNGVWL